MVKFSALLPCSVANCPNLATSRTYCQTHYSRWWKHGDVQAHIPIKTRQTKNPTKQRRCRKCNNAEPDVELPYMPTKKRYDTVCTTCQSRDLAEYRRSKRSEDTDYWVSRRLKYNYRLTMESYREMLDRQDGRCAICKRTAEEATNNRHPRLVVDHDHRCCPSGKSCGKCIRGLLCYNCNQALGQFMDSPTVLRVAAEYIEVNGEHR